MKKNEAMGYLVYALMIVIAIVVGLTVIRPVFGNADYANALPMNGILFILLAVIGGILVTAILLEVGHVLGALLGHYEVRSVNCLGIEVRKEAKGSWKPSFASFDGITGETRVTPKDIKTSNPRHFIYLPLFFFLLEVIACVAVMAFAKAKSVSEPSWIWGYVFACTVLAVGGMIFLYDIFPAPLDSKNDGYLITILTNQTNVEAYNQMLLAEDRIAKGLPAGETPVYEKVTDFTSRINDVAIYENLRKRDYQEAMRIVEFAIKSKDSVSSGVYHAAVAQKLALMFYLRPLEEVRQFYIDLPLDDKKYIASLSNGPCVRSYILISGLVEDSLSETEEAMGKADSALRGLGADKKPIEEELIREAVKKVLERHPDWDLSAFGFGKPEIKAEPNREEGKKTQESSVQSPDGSQSGDNEKKNQ
jgi:hypothetical protein